MIPSQTFTTITQLFNYLNSLIIPNGNNAITGEEVNNVLNGLGNFIVKYGVNTQLAGISSSSGVVPLSKPVTIFTVVPASVNWSDNVQFEYYIVNATGTNIPLTAGYSYTDQYGVQLTVIPARTSIHIAKATNGTWFQVNNPLNSGSGANLPPQTSHDGQVLFTDGNSAFWGSVNVSLVAGMFEPDGRTYLDPRFGVICKVSVFWNDINKYIYERDGDWQYVSSPAGIKILNPGFDANTQPNLNVELLLKGLNG